MTHISKFLTALSITIAAAAPAAASTFSTMGVEEVSELLSQVAAPADYLTLSAMDNAAKKGASTQVKLTAEDMVSKLYGVIDASVSKKECVRQSKELLHLTPEDDNDALWLETATGFGVDYYGMNPDVSAMARFGNDQVSDFGYFFLFPYTASTKADSVREQADFCSSLLQEMMDMGLPMDLNTATDDLFEAVGDYNGSLVDVRLLDEAGNGQGGRYILILSIEPNAFTPADDILAEL